MNSTELEQYYDDGHRCKGAGYLRFILMAFMCFWNYGFPEPTGVLSAISGFAAPAFFILSGYFVLVEDMEKRQKKTERKMKRSILFLAAMIVLNIIVNVIVCLIKNISVTISKRIIFNFVVLNLWPLPIGNSIWFIQSLVYAYIIIYIADWLGLMKYYKAVMIMTFVFMLFTGEFAGIIHFNILGYRFIPGNWLTRALPYLLLGKYLREKSEILFRINNWIYAILFVAGAGLSVGEIILLGKTGFLVYQGHLIGYGIMAVAVCGMALSNPEANRSRITYCGTALSGIVYLLIDPIYFIIGLVMKNINISFVQYFGGIAALLLCIVISFIMSESFIARAFFTRWDNNGYVLSSDQ